MSSRRLAVATFLCVAGGSSVLLAQAPTTAQVWDVRFIPDADGPFASGPLATQVGITIFARVGILPNTSASGQANLGVAKAGGTGSATTGFRMTFTDSVSAAQGQNQGTLARGLTGDIDHRSLTDTNGQPLAGTFGAFRGGFTPQVAPNFVGSNTIPINGSFNNPATGSPMVFNVSHGRSLNFGSDGSGPMGVATAPDSNPANLVGELAPVYRLYFFPSANLLSQGGGIIDVQVNGLAVRYNFALNGNNASSSSDNVLGSRNFSFDLRVPAPGAAGLAGLVAASSLRRRRRA